MAWGVAGFFYHTSLFNEDLPNGPNSAGSISLDSTFKKQEKSVTKYVILAYYHGSYCFYCFPDKSSISHAKKEVIMHDAVAF
jgi:hypothetical protein